MGVTLEGEQGSFDPSHTHLRSKERCLEYRLYLKFFPVPYKRLPVVAEWVFFRAHCAYLHEGSVFLRSAYRYWVQSSRFNIEVAANYSSS
jgi:hypothetical protein